MNQTPQYLPEERWHEKPKNDFLRRNPYGLGCALAALIVFVLGIVGVAALILLAPNIIPDYDATASSLDLTAVYLRGQAQDQLFRQTQDAIRRTDEALQLAGTQNALENQANLLRLTETQGARAIFATQTADAITNVQMQTQAAIDYSVTQFAIDQLATRAAIDNQATQQALNAQSTALAATSFTPLPFPTFTPAPGS